PTLELVDQWVERLGEGLGVEVGKLGGGANNPLGVTVATYDSAYIYAPRLGNRYKLVVFDEVHHLPAPGYSQMAEMLVAPYRLGLTATPEREDGRHAMLTRLVGMVVYRRGVDKLVGKHLAKYRLERIVVELTPEERKEYEKNDEVFKGYVRTSKVFVRGRGFQGLVLRSGFDPKAREALLAREKARKIALNSENKIRKLSELLAKHSDDKILVFTQHNSLVYQIADRFLIPPITHRTGVEERKEILAKFRRGVYRRVVTSKVLDEGIDVPDANIGIILSGTGSSREFVQRLGRILRKKDGEAILYEIITKETLEERTSQRRKRHIKKGLS
ncbi:MAG: ATP-dependent helicase, partial [Methanobacteriota archaeon]